MKPCLFVVGAEHATTDWRGNNKYANKKNNRMTLFGNAKRILKTKFDLIMRIKG